MDTKDPQAEVEPTETLGEEEASSALQASFDEQRSRLDQVTRAYAELVNDRDAFKRRLERERDRQLETSRAEIASALLETVDELELALLAEPHQGEALAKGVRLIAEGLHRRAQGLGLERIESDGALFNPEIHEAFELVPVDDRELDGRVIGELRSGWRTGARVVRAARVKVARFVPRSGATAEEPGVAAGPSPRAFDPENATE